MKEPKKYRQGGSVESGFERALRSNAEALTVYEAMTPQQQQAFRRQGEQAHSPEEWKALTDALVGWKTGHPPYQL